MKTKAVLFDMDGVILDSYKAWFNLFNLSLENFNKPKVSEGEFKEKFWGTPLKEGLNYLEMQDKYAVVLKFINNNFKRYFSHIVLFRDSKLVLKKIREKKLKTALVTNSPKKLTNDLMDYLKLKKYFSTIITGEDVEKGKPEPEMLIKACKKLNINPAEAILVGDTKKDIIAGKKAGCFTIGVNIDADKKISNLKELLNMI